MNVYDARWNNARNFIQRIKELADTNEYVLMFDGDTLTDGYIEVDDENREINIVFPGCCINIFNSDPDYDEGAHTPVKEWIDEMKTRLRVFREISIE